MSICLPTIHGKFLKTRELILSRLGTEQCWVNMIMNLFCSHVSYSASWWSQLDQFFLFSLPETMNFKPGTRNGGGSGSVPSEEHHGKRKSPAAGVRGNNTAVNKWDVQWGSCNSSGPHFLLQNEDISKAPSPPQAQTFYENLHEGRFRKLTFQLIEPCGVTAWRIKLLFITVHFLSLA